MSSEYDANMFACVQYSIRLSNLMNSSGFCICFLNDEQLYSKTLMELGMNYN